MINIYSIIATLAIVLLLGFAGAMDAESDLILENGNCAMVEDGYYPPEMCKR